MFDWSFVLCSHIWQYFPHHSTGFISVCSVCLFLCVYVYVWVGECMVPGLECQTMRVQIVSMRLTTCCVRCSGDPLSLEKRIDILFNATEFQPWKSAWNHLNAIELQLTNHLKPAKDISIVTKLLLFFVVENLWTV